MEYHIEFSKMTKSQKEIIEWHIEKGVIFKEILSIKTLKDKKVNVETPAFTFEIGIRGGISIKYFCM